ncbi:MAG: alanine--glyoxylate aminotransferase family protein, partial [Chloroflexota bacterium]
STWQRKPIASSSSHIYVAFSRCRCHVDEQYRLPSLTTVRLPANIDEADARKRLLHDYHIEVGGGLGELKGKVWRIGLMGYTSNEANVNALIGALKTIVQ